MPQRGNGLKDHEADERSYGESDQEEGNQRHKNLVE
jgi:hypothetical protein